MKEGIGKIYKLGAYSFVIRLPKTVVEDSTFPFELGDTVMVRIEGDKLIISKGDEDAN